MKESKVAIIDADSILFSAAWGTKISDGKGDYLRDEKGRLIYKDKSKLEITVDLDSILNTILTDTEATDYIIFVKGKNTAAHRYAAKNDYKALRPKESPHWWDYTREYLIDAWEAVSVDNIEVDDACNISRLQIPNSFMVAIDKDLLNLEGIHYNWKKKSWIKINNSEESQLFWKDMIIGQPGDGISGLKGKGSSYFYKNVLPQVFDMYNNDFYEKLPSIILNEYIEHYGEYIGIQEYYKNYICLKILDKYDNFILPKPIKYEVKEEGLNNLFK